MVINGKEIDFEELKMQAYQASILKTKNLAHFEQAKPLNVVDEWGRKAAVYSAGESITPFVLYPSDSQLLFYSPSLSPLILHRVPHLTHARFLTVSGGIPPSSFPQSSPPSVFHILTTKPLGFTLTTASSFYHVPVMGLDKGEAFVAKERFFSRVLKILVQLSSDLRELGYLMVCSLHSVHWYCVKYDESRGIPVLSYLGCQQFKSCSVASASWSSQLSGDCLVLLENGESLLSPEALGVVVV
ncbi:hypothetical protein F2Q70_00006354 [Brassica cretica]|uniref:Uncharacterized protein n=1 Tax=Brassica cretica TaxID=69181 RepID=A0A3N6RI11_BRACR|nr:hypothetical protein F2Q70_00006354 [Brassica cretica]